MIGRELDNVIADAREAGLRYVSDADPGIRRRKYGARFAYYNPSGERITDPQTLARLRAIAVPPAWTDVWICPKANGHLQATGRDRRGRKQYRYHRRWREVRDEAKFHRLIAFAETLPRIRRQVARDLQRHGLPREKVLATVVRLLEVTDIRVGNEEYARENDSYGLTTLRDEHAVVNSTYVTFRFVGKGGKLHELDVRDRTLARIAKRCQDLPGHRLFAYLDEKGVERAVESDDVNDYLRSIGGNGFTAKDFRTWNGTLLAAVALREAGAASTEREATRVVKAAIEQAAEALRNTPTVCRTSYVHPAVIDAYMEGRVMGPATGRGPRALTGDERALLAFLRAETAADIEHEGAQAAG